MGARQPCRVLRTTRGPPPLPAGQIRETGSSQGAFRQPKPMEFRDKVKHVNFIQKYIQRKGVDRGGGLAAVTARGAADCCADPPASAVYGQLDLFVFRSRFEVLPFLIVICMNCNETGAEGGSCTWSSPGAPNILACIEGILLQEGVGCGEGAPRSKAFSCCSF